MSAFADTTSVTKDQRGGWPSALLLLGIGATVWFNSRDGASTPRGSIDTAITAPYSSRHIPAYEARRVLAREDAIDQFWDEIKPNLNGSETVEACSLDSGNCYDLEAEISSGVIETLHFNNGGWLILSADIDQFGDASDVDDEGRWWDFRLDMNSSLVDDAISEWSAVSRIEVEY